MVAWGEDSHLVHVCAGGVFMEGPVDCFIGGSKRDRRS
jgi:hypothetical protein